MKILIWIGCIFGASIFGTLFFEYFGQGALFVAEIVAVIVAPKLCRKYNENKSHKEDEEQEINQDDKGDVEEENDKDDKNIGVVEEQTIQSSTDTAAVVFEDEGTSLFDVLLCPYCGKELPLDSDFCQYCGAKLG